MCNYKLANKIGPQIGRRVIVGHFVVSIAYENTKIGNDCHMKIGNSVSNNEE